MSNKRFHIPRHGGAGPSLFGVEFKETYILIVSVFIALIAGRFFGAIAYIGIPFAGFHINKKFLEWKEHKLPGFFRSVLFGAGLKSYSKAFKSQSVVFVGDGKVINSGNAKALEESDEPKQEEL